MAGPPPLAVDIDGTLTRSDKSIDPRIFEPLRRWSDEVPVVVATGKAFPFPVALCEFLGIPINVIAENGGAVYVEECGEVAYNGDPELARAVADDYREAGYDLGWGGVDMVNRWRETEIAVSRRRPLDVLERIAAERGMDVVDTGYAYHVKSPGVNKASGLRTVAEIFGRDPEAFAAIGDSENDAELFELAGTAYAVANADSAAKAFSDAVTDCSFADGFLEALELIRGSSSESCQT